MLAFCELELRQPCKTQNRQANWTTFGGMLGAPWGGDSGGVTFRVQIGRRVEAAT